MGHGCDGKAVFDLDAVVEDVWLEQAGGIGHRVSFALEKRLCFQAALGRVFYRIGGKYCTGVRAAWNFQVAFCWDGRLPENQQQHQSNHYPSERQHSR